MLRATTHPTQAPPQLRTLRLQLAAAGAAPLPAIQHATPGALEQEARRQMPARARAAAAAATL
jgi:hypothetical protein